MTPKIETVALMGSSVEWGNDIMYWNIAQSMQHRDPENINGVHGQNMILSNDFTHTKGQLLQVIFHPVLVWYEVETLEKIKKAGDDFMKLLKRSTFQNSQKMEQANMIICGHRKLMQEKRKKINKKIPAGIVSCIVPAVAGVSMPLPSSVSVPESSAPAVSSVSELEYSAPSGSGPLSGPKKGINMAAAVSATDNRKVKKIKINNTLDIPQS